MSRLLVTLLLVAQVAWAERSVGPQLGQSPSAVLDDKGDRVGTGPALGIFGTAPAKPPATGGDQSAWNEATRWTAAFLEQMAVLDHDMNVIGFLLRANVLAIKELEREIAGDERLLAKSTRADLRELLERSIATAKADLAALVKERDDRLNSALDRWRDLRSALVDKIGASADKPEVASMLGKLDQVVQRRQTIGELTLYLQSGYSERFRTLAAGAEQDPLVAPNVQLLRVQDFLDQGSVSMALQLARDGAGKFKDQPIGAAFARQAQSLDVAYMKMLADTNGREADQIQKAWANYTGQVSDSYIKQFFSGSMRHTFEYYSGMTNRLEKLTANEADMKAMGGHGLQAMIRLRGAGMSFKEIMALDGDGIKQAFKSKLGADISYESADMINTAVSVALRDQRLMNMVKGNQVASEAELGKGWAGQEEFRDSLVAQAADCINVKNALLLLGPGAVVSSAGTGASLTARFAQVVGRGVDGAKRMEALFGSGLEGAVTARDWLSSAVKLPEIAGALARGKTGAALRDGLNTWFSARYDGPLAARLVMGAEEICAELAIFETAGRAGKKLGSYAGEKLGNEKMGGAVGEFFGQAMATLVGNPASLANEAFGKARVSAVKATMAEFRAAEGARRMATELADAAKTAEEAASKMARGETLAADELAKVERAGTRAQEIGAEATNLEARAAEAGGGAPPAVSSVAEQAQAVDGLAQAVRRGDAAAAEIAGETANRGASQLEAAVTTSEKAEAGLAQSAERMAGAPEPTASSSDPLIDAAQPGPKTFVPDKPGPGVTTEAKLGSAPTEPPLKSARNAMRAGEFEEAETWYRQAARNPDLTEEDVALIRQGITEAKQAQRYQKILAERAESTWLPEARARADQALEPLADTEKAYLQSLEANKQVEFYKYFDTEPTAGGPRVIFDKDGKLMGIWKPAAPPGGAGLQGMPDDGNMVAEVFASRLARKLGLPVPHAEPIAMVGKGGDAVQGVFIRWVPGTHIVHKLEPGAQAVLAEQIAKFRAMSAYLGNYDVHLGNYLVDGSGRVWGIDFGNSCLSKIPVDDADILRQIMHVPKYPLSGDDVVDEARLLRDAYTYRKVQRGATGPNAAVLEQGQFYKEQVAHLDRLMPATTMNPVADELRKLSDTELETMLKGALSRGSAQQNAEGVREIVARLRERGANIDKILDKWKSTDFLDADVLVPPKLPTPKTPVVK